MSDSGRHAPPQLDGHGTRSGPQGAAREGRAGSGRVGEKQRASVEMRATTSSKRDPGFTVAPALGPSYPGFQLGVPPQLWVPSQLMRGPPTSVAPSAGGQKGVGNPQLHQHRVPGACAEWARENRPPVPGGAPLQSEWGRGGVKGDREMGQEAATERNNSEPSFLKFLLWGPRNLI